MPKVLHRRLNTYVSSLLTFAKDKLVQPANQILTHKRRLWKTSTSSIGPLWASGISLQTTMSAATTVMASGGSGKSPPRI